MPTVGVKIWLALKSRIDTIPLDFDKAWPAETFTPTYEGNFLSPYLRIGRVSVDPLAVFIEDGKRQVRTGTLIITLVHPIRPNTPVAVYDQYAGQIAQHFIEGTQMRYDDVCVKVNSQPHVQPGYEDNNYWTVPVSIPWRTFA